MVRKGARKTKKGGFFNLFSRSGQQLSSKVALLPKNFGKGKTEKKKGKRVKIGTETKELGLYNNEQDCLMELRKPKNKGAKCRLIGYASYALEKEVSLHP